MIVKGIVSAIDTESKKVSVILPEYDVVTRAIKTYPAECESTLSVNDLVLVAIFNNDFNDCMILCPASNSVQANLPNYENEEF